MNGRAGVGRGAVRPPAEQGGDDRNMADCWQAHWPVRLNRMQRAARAMVDGCEPHDEAFELEAGTDVGRVVAFYRQVGC